MTCFHLQERIKKLNIDSQVVDKQIDLNQEKVTGLLKQCLEQSHIRAHRVFLSEQSTQRYNRSILKEKVFATESLEIADSLTSLELPEEFSKVPIKSFLNVFFDNINSFLPVFFNLNPSKIYRGTFLADPAVSLMRCVIPSIFGYCWAREPAISYARNLSKWFGVLVSTKSDFFSDFLDHWMFQAYRGFFLLLNFGPFIQKAIRPVFCEFIQYNMVLQVYPDLLFIIAKKMLNNIMEYFYLIPEVVNETFEFLFYEIDQLDKNNDEKNLMKTQVLKHIFYDCIIKPILEDPFQNDVFDIPLLIGDYENFQLVYSIFLLRLSPSTPDFKFTNFFENHKHLFEDFDPFRIMEPILEKKASLPMPSQHTFCTLVQCAHQPLLFSTHTLLLLFRFIVSLQQATNFPKAINRPINSIFEQNLDQQLQSLPEHFFWFPCYSLQYLEIPPITFFSKIKPSPLYKLLSSPHLQISPEIISPKESLQNAMELVPLQSRPDIRAQVLWMLQEQVDLPKSVENLIEEIGSMTKLILEKRERAKQLQLYSRYLIESINYYKQEGVLMSIGYSLFPQFLNEIKTDIDMTDKTKLLVQEILGTLFPVLGKYIVQCIIMAVSPTVKYEKPPPPVPESNDPEIRIMRNMVNRTYNLTCLLPNIIMISRDVSAILWYGKMNSIERPVKKCYSAPFLDNPSLMASRINTCLMTLAPDVLSILFSKNEIEALSAFSQSFAE